MSLKELVVCKFDGCNQVFNDPRILPCGNRTCAAHIDEMMISHEGVNSDSRMIKCQLCHKIHTVPEDSDGFLVDKNISLLLNMKHSGEHDTAKENFNEVKQLLAKLSKLDAEAYAIEFFKQVEADIQLEKEVNLEALIAHYEKLVDEVRERKARCLDNLKINETLGRELEPINQALKEFDRKLKRDNVDFILKTLDGDEAKWKEIQSSCNLMLEKVKSLDEQLLELIVGDESIGFRPSASHTPIEDICGQLDHVKLDSLVISSFKMENDLVELCKLNGFNFKLIYRASRDGFAATDFHAKCDSRPMTLTIIKTTDGFVFGAYTAVAWDSTSGYKADPDAFIFSLINPNSDLQLIRVTAAENNYAIYCKAGFGPTFGGGHDIKIWNNSNTTTESYSNLGSSYDFSLFDCGTIRAQSFLAGSRNFQTSEIEVFACTQIENVCDLSSEIVRDNDTVIASESESE